MSMVTQEESTMAVDCVDCEFSIMIYHNHGNLEPRWVTPSEKLQEKIP